MFLCSCRVEDLLCRGRVGHVLCMCSGRKGRVLAACLAAILLSLRAAGGNRVPDASSARAKPIASLLRQRKTTIGWLHARRQAGTSTAAQLHASPTGRPQSTQAIVVP